MNHNASSQDAPVSSDQNLVQKTTAANPAKPNLFHMVSLFNKIGNRILLLVGVSATVILLGMMVFQSHHEQKQLMEQNVRARTEMVGSIIHGLKSVMRTGTASIAQGYASELKNVEGIVELRIMRVDGTEAFLDNKTIEEVNIQRGKESFAPREDEQTIQVISNNTPQLLEAVQQQRPVYYEETEKDGTPLLTFLVPIKTESSCTRCHGGESAVRGVVLLSTSMAPMRAAIQEVRERSALILIGGLCLLLVLVWFLIRRSVVNRISQVTRAMVQVSQGDMTLQVPSLGHDELTDMADSFNHMVNQLLHTYTGFQQERNKLATIILSARDGIIVTDHQEKVVLVNPAAERLLGKTSQKIVSDGFLHFLDDPDYITRYIATGGRDMPETVVYNQRVLSINAASIRSPQGGVIGSAALIRDVTEEKRLEQELRFLSYTDKLTGLNNRRRMEEMLATEYERARRYGLCLSYLQLDVDHFKRFNDEHGHDQGDRILQALGEVMRDHFRKTDFPCRYGGEEFCVILTSTPSSPDLNGAWIAADRFRQKVEAMRVNGLKVTVSIGLAAFPAPGIDAPEDLIKEADIALYEAKRNGRNQVVVAKRMANMAINEA